MDPHADPMGIPPPPPHPPYIYLKSQYCGYGGPGESVGTHFFPTHQISLLINRFQYYTTDFFTTLPISLLRNRFLYYTDGIFTTQPIDLQYSRFLDYTADFFTTQSIFCATPSIFFTKHVICRLHQRKDRICTDGPKAK